MTTYRKTCENCKAQYTCPSKRQRFCSHRCAHLTRRMSFERPPRSYRDDLQRGVAEAVVSERLARNLSQPELAELAHVSKDTVARIEHGNAGYSVHCLAMVLGALGLEARVSPAEAAR